MSLFPFLSTELKSINSSFRWSKQIYIMTLNLLVISLYSVHQVWPMNHIKTNIQILKWRDQFRFLIYIILFIYKKKLTNITHFEKYIPKCHISFTFSRSHRRPATIFFCSGCKNATFYHKKQAVAERGYYFLKVNTFWYIFLKVRYICEFFYL